MTAVLPAGIAAQQALAQQNVALGAIKRNAEAEQALANVLLETVSASSRGGNVNTSA